MMCSCQDGVCRPRKTIVGVTVVNREGPPWMILYNLPCLIRTSRITVSRGGDLKRASLPSFVTLTPPFQCHHTAGLRITTKPVRFQGHHLRPLRLNLRIKIGHQTLGGKMATLTLHFLVTSMIAQVLDMGGRKEMEEESQLMFIQEDSVMTKCTDVSIAPTKSWVSWMKLRWKSMP